MRIICANFCVVCIYCAVLEHRRTLQEMSHLTDFQLQQLVHVSVRRIESQRSLTSLSLLQFIAESQCNSLVLLVT